MSDKQAKDESRQPETEAATTNQPGPLKNLPFAYPEDGPIEIYSNFANINWTPSDIRIRFGQLLGSQKSYEAPPEFVAQENICVTMSWFQAKELMKLLTGVVDRFEKVNGEIKGPKFPI